MNKNEQLVKQNKQEVVNYIIKLMQEKSSIFENIDWMSLPDKYFELFEKIRNNQLEEKELLEFLNNTSQEFANQLKTYADSQNSAITPRLIEKHPVAAARRFFRDWLQIQQNNDELKK